ncbi:MAG: tetraacyldisaccharide 4'-kinase [Betaproteobacteria bacterium]|nr:MAG: tetraacyldisaccharide 4'-kinase [Betaproteobacteria bacterium]
MTSPDHWQTRDLTAVLLLPVAMLFAAVAALRRGAYRCGLLRGQRIGVPVIVVGNITVGGTGKTPLTLWLAHFLQQQGWHPGIISRGYGAARTDSRAVPVNGAARDFGDEPCLLARRAGCPVWVGADRAATARALLVAQPKTDVIISDDGLQHYRLARDFEIALIDGARGLGNGWPLPAGPLREPASRLATVDAVVINGEDTCGITQQHAQATIMRLAGNQFRKLLNPAHAADAAQFRGQRVHAVAGIGNPQRFFAHLRQLGLDCIPHAFPDHHIFRPQDVDFPDAHSIVMTQKDAVKCEPFATGRHWALVVNAEPDVRLGEMILTRLAKARRHG